MSSVCGDYFMIHRLSDETEAVRRASVAKLERVVEWAHEIGAAHLDVVAKLVAHLRLDVVTPEKSVVERSHAGREPIDLRENAGHAQICSTRSSTP